jgi:hypothetical protein
LNADRGFVDNDVDFKEIGCAFNFIEFDIYFSEILDVEGV